MLLTAAVSLAAGLGALARYVLDQVIAHRTGSDLPFGTFAINISGSFLLGLLLGLAAHHGLAGAVVDVAGAGFAGGYTTWSTWTYETLALARSGDRWAALLNVGGSLAAGLLAAAAGLGLARWAG